MKNYLIIGGSTGIGKSLTNILSKSGYQVFSTFNKNPQNVLDDNVNYSFLDVKSENINFDFLPDTIHGIAYCPGSINLKPFKRISPEAFESDYKIQVIGAIKVIQEVLPKLKTAGNASIVLFSTVAVKLGFNFHSQVAASKGALEGLTRSLAAEFAPRIRVNAIAPSLTDTPLAAKLLNSDEKRIANAQRNPLKRIGAPSDIGEMAAFLLTDKSSWITGQIFYIDGGMSSIK